jgi:hypothetical protein
MKLYFFLILIVILFFSMLRENYKTYNTPLDLIIGKIKNKHIISKETIVIKNNKIIIGNKTITHDDINAFKALPLHYDNKMCLPDEDGECIEVSNFQNLKKYWNDGTIIAYSGELKKIPRNWNICDGTNGTPDLRDRFIVGVGKKYKLNSTGGKETHQLTLDEIPTHKHTMTFPAQSNEIGTSKPINVGDISYGRHGDHLGKYGDGFASMCRTDGVNNKLNPGIDFIPGNNLMECVANITATQKDIHGKTKYRNKQSKQPIKQYTDRNTSPPVVTTKSSKSVQPFRELLDGVIDLVNNEPVPLYEVLYNEKDNIKSVGYRISHSDVLDYSKDVCRDTCMYFRNTDYWESEQNIKNKKGMWFKSILINDGKNLLINKKKNIYPELVKQNVKPGNGYYVGPTSNACQNCYGNTSKDGSINYNLFKLKSTGSLLDTTKISVAVSNNKCYSNYKKIVNVFYNNLDTSTSSPEKETYGKIIGTSPTPNQIFDYLTKFEGTPCLDNDEAKGHPHTNMPSYYRVIFLMRNVHIKPITTTTAHSIPTSSTTKKMNRCSELINNIKKSGVAPVYLNCD